MTVRSGCGIWQRCISQMLRKCWISGTGPNTSGAGAKAASGQSCEVAREQGEQGKRRLLADGYCGVVEWVGEMTAAGMLGGDGPALGGVLNYFAGHQTRLNYALRLRRGQSIGSGLIEGSIKQLLNKRIKQTAASWKVDHVGPFVELGALAASPEWQAFWEDN